MKCPNCASNIRRPSEVCANCGFSIAGLDASGQPQQTQPPASLRPRHLFNAFLLLLLVLFSVGFFGFLIYTGYFWFDSWRVDRVYASTELREPDIEEIELEDGRLGRAFTFYGRDGDELFIPELSKSYMFVGGMTRIEIADSSWFDLSPENEEAAIVTLMPVIHTEGNGRIQLPPVEVTIETPVSPLVMINPSTDSTSVNTSRFALEFKVVPGSKVLVGGEDVSGSSVNHEGNVFTYVNVYPVGDNVISISVQTPHHKQTRKDIVLQRPQQSINLEPSMNRVKSTTKSTVTISGTSEPGAMIVVDSKYVEDSLKVNEAGDFSFQAKLSIIGDNIITYHATMPGREDTFMSETVYYVPTLTAYADRAWKMDYELLKKMTDTWNGRIFLCAGPVVEVIEGTDPQLVAMNVAPEGESPQIVILENMSNKGTPVVGQKYRAYADVSGIYFYGDDRCPQLVMRYMLDN